MTQLGHNQSFTGLSREQKIQRLRSRQIDVVQGSAANVFSIDVPVRKRRMIVGLLMTNTDASPITVTVSKVLNSDSLEDFLDTYVLDGVSNDSFNKDSPVNLDYPLLVLTGGQNIQFACNTSGKTARITIWWYDFPR